MTMEEGAQRALLSPDIKDLAKALAKAWEDMPDILKDKTAEGTKFSYNYADLSTILKATGPHLAKNGLSVVQLPDGDHFVTTLLHSSGQWIRGFMTMPTLSDPQKMGSWITYMRRYAFNGAIGVSPQDDDDGNHVTGTGAKTKPKAKEKEPMISAAQLAGINETMDWLDDNGGGGWTAEAFYGWMGTMSGGKTRPEQLTAKDAETVQTMLNAKTEEVTK